MKQREIQTGNSIICSEIKRNYETPENILVAIILVSILSYCDKFIKIYELTESLKGFDHTIYELKIIRKNVYLMLSKQLFRKILPVAIGLRNSLNTLIELISKRVKQQKISFHFINIFKLVYEWNYFISISFNNEEIARHVLQYYFMKITNINDLFECWIYVKLLFEISKKFDIKLKEVNSNRGACTFVSNDRSLNLIYQAKYDSRWKKQNNDEIYDYPDIVLEFTNGQRVIIDAKNSKYQYNNPTPNFGQMRSYLRSADAQYGFFIHSNSENPNLWYKITDEKNTKQIVWTTLRPGENDINLKKILSIPSI